MRLGNAMVTITNLSVICEYFCVFFFKFVFRYIQRNHSNVVSYNHQGIIHHFQFGISNLYFTVNKLMQRSISIIKNERKFSN